jgi:leader peptidase (prepilin peptidase) / N-methyltransferase
MKIGKTIQYIDFFPEWAVLTLGIFGFLIFGSFLGAAIYRLPLKYIEGKKPLSLLWGRSMCPHCHKRLKFWHLIPIISWLIQKGKCVYCKTSISPNYIVIESVAPLLFIVGYFLIDDITIVILIATLGAILLAITIIDLKYLLIPDELQISLLMLGAIYLAIYADGFPTSHIVGAIFAGGLFLALRQFYFKIRKIEGLGMGDIKLIFIAGLWLGLMHISYAILIAALGTLLFIVIQRIFGIKKGRTEHIPFGPGIAFGFFVTFILKLTIIPFTIY